MFVDVPLSEGASVTPGAGQAHYLGTVMRRGVGDEVILFNGRDGEWRTRIAALRKDKASLIVESRLRPQTAEAGPWLAFVPLKRDATELVVEKATELGASALLPVITERTNTTRLNLDRLRAIAIEAAEQCERLSVPELHPPVPLAQLLAGWPADRRLFAALERAEVPPIRPARGIAGLLIGPEGGFSPREHELLSNSGKATPISLGPRILRAETAAIVGLALLQAPGCG